MRKRALMAICSLALIGGGCVDANTSSPATQATGPASSDRLAMGEAEKAECRAAGGEVEQRGRLQSELCVTPYADGGKACTDSAQCDGKCIVEGQATPSQEDPVQGICQRDDRLFGCYSEVKGGALTAGLCVD